MGNDGKIGIATYVLVFLCVVVPYLLSDLAVRLPRGGKAARAKSLPLAYRLAYPAIAWAADAVGLELARLRPERTEDIRRKLLLAARPVQPAFVFGAQVVFCCAGLAAALPVFAATGDALPALVAGGALAACGWFLPAFELERAADERQERIVKDLPFAIDLVSTAMHAGLDFNAAIRYYVTLGLPNALTSEFAQMLRETELGLARVEALSAMAARIQSPAFTSFADAVAHGSEIGAPLVGTMKMQGEDTRRARFNIAERKAQRAPSLMIFPMALFIVPAAFIVIGVPVYLRFNGTGL